MGGERASTIHMREAGKICAVCGVTLPPPHVPGERRCIGCGGKRRVYMTFFLRGAWHCQFLEEDCQTSLPRKLNFSDPRKIIALIEHAGAFGNLESRQAIDLAIDKGRGGIWLELTGEQYQKFKSR